MTDFSYVRDYYGVPACLGRRVTVGGKAAVITAVRGHYIGITYDTDKPGIIRNAHPTSEVVYGEMGTVRPMTRSQRRYSEFLDVADLYDNFAHFLRSRKATP